MKHSKKTVYYSIRNAMPMSNIQTIKILNLKNSLFFRYPNFYLGEAVFDKYNDKEKKNLEIFCLCMHMVF